MVRRRYRLSRIFPLREYLDRHGLLQVLAEEGGGYMLVRDTIKVVVLDEPIGQDIIQGFFIRVRAHDLVGVALRINFDGSSEEVWDTYDAGNPHNPTLVKDCPLVIGGVKNQPFTSLFSLVSTASNLDRTFTEFLMLSFFFTYQLPLKGREVDCNEDP
ncbi:hypothetical protein GOBAR_AA16505 [Gossypium barbadense]|uniref:Uncharacterized protein n=1 Tax=Gossypium barbadense TaxID=3634 RepID=A0A2P5XLD2_GOSBA|nr:hypothetical protein GOBAR_AA16505 [Gossypium barbadense]